MPKKLQTRIGSMVLALVMILTLLPVSAMAADVKSTTAATSGDTAIFAAGTGTASDPYVIQTPDQLRAFRDSVNAGETYQSQVIRLDASLSLDDESWTPIGIVDVFHSDLNLLRVI